MKRLIITSEGGRAVGKWISADEFDVLLALRHRRPVDARKLANLLRNHDPQKPLAPAILRYLADVIDPDRERRGSKRKPNPVSLKLSQMPLNSSEARKFVEEKFKQTFSIAEEVDKETKRQKAGDNSRPREAAKKRIANKRGKSVSTIEKNLRRHKELNNLLKELENIWSHP